MKKSITSFVGRFTQHRYISGLFVLETATSLLKQLLFLEHVDLTFIFGKGEPYWDDFLNALGDRVWNGPLRAVQVASF